MFLLLLDSLLNQHIFVYILNLHLLIHEIFSGKGLNDFDNNVTSFACTDISSVLVLNTNPVIPTISPIS